MSKIVTPINCSKKTEKIINNKPIKAEVINSCPACILFGSPAEVIIIKTAASIRIKAIPPPRPMPNLKIEAVRALALETSIQPIAVETQVAVFVGAVVPGGFFDIVGVLFKAVVHSAGVSQHAV